VSDKAAALIKRRRDVCAKREKIREEVALDLILFRFQSADRTDFERAPATSYLSLSLSRHPLQPYSHLHD